MKVSKEKYTQEEELFEEPIEEVSEDTKETLLNESTNEVTLDNGSEESVTLKSQTKVTIESTPIQFSDVSDNRVSLSDFYHDARSFLAQANSTKFILIAFLMITIPILLLYGFISEDVYKEMVILLAITYLGVDVYEKKSLIKNKKK